MLICEFMGTDGHIALNLHLHVVKSKNLKTDVHTIIVTRDLQNNGYLCIDC